ncbi:MAG: low temperature requirement protein A, partial [Thermoleophilaceae bacterium]|nr:low temperature requirement protein A [Thermoleophilaceae bacterium]
MQPQPPTAEPTFEVPSRLFRRREGEERATSLELFFDLVYVFAITQLAIALVSDISVAGIGQSMLVLLAVWWAWNYTTWMTNWFDPDLITVRLVLMATMLLSLLMAVAIPTAFTTGGLFFAISYVTLQALRNGFNVVTMPHGNPRRTSFTRIFVWGVAAGIFWIAGGLSHGDARVALWVMAVAIDYAGPFARYWTPGLGPSALDDWDIDAGHFAERFQLLIIIALGESIVVIGSSVAATVVTLETVLALVIGFITTACMWWLYFDFIAEAARRRLAMAPDPGKLARDGFTYLHLPLVAGIIAYAVALKLVIKHPAEELTGNEILITVIGPILYLLGHAGFRYRMTGTFSKPRIVATAALIALVPLASQVDSLAFIALVMTVMLVLVVWETIEVRRWYASFALEDRPETLMHLEKHIRR